MKKVYEFDFCFPPKERERATVRGGKVIVYSPDSTRKAYKMIRTHIHVNYPNYVDDIVDYEIKATLEIHIMKEKTTFDIDNAVKMLDSLNPEKDGGVWKGIWQDDRLIKHIEAKFVYVDSKEKHKTILTLEPFGEPDGN